MFALSAATKVYLAAGATDLRKGFDGLCAIVEGVLEEAPLSGHVFLFANATRTRLKVLVWDGSGLWVCTNSHAPQCALWFILENCVSVPPAFWERIRNFRFCRW